MIFTTREDVDAPIEQVFEMITEFDSYERAAMRRGADVQRLDMCTVAGAGMKWRANFLMRGKEREVEATIIRFEHPTEIAVETISSGLDGAGNLQLLALSKTRTRLAVEFEVKATTLSARLLLQSLKLAKSTLNKRFKLRAAQFAKALEDRANSA